MPIGRLDQPTRIRKRAGPRATSVLGPGHSAGGAPAHPLLGLQRQIGNRALTALVTGLRTPTVQRAPSAIRTDYSHLDVTSAGAEIDNSGAFVGLSAEEYRAAKKRLRKQGKGFKEAAVRVEMLARKVDGAWQRLQLEQAQQPAGSQVLGVFTAPEWFFKKPDNPFSAEDKDRIIEAFRSLSEQYTQLVLVPGTIVWSEGEGDNRKIRNTAFVTLNGHLVKIIDKAKNLGDTDSYFRVERDPSTHDLPSKGEVDAAWQRDRTPAVKNSVPDDPSVFDIGNVRFSVEICGDFGRAKADQVAGRAPASGVDVQILVSHSAYLMSGLLITKPGAIAIHNDAVPDRVRGARRETRISPLPGSRAAAPTVKTIGQGDTSIDDFHLGSVPLPANTPAARRARAGVYIDVVRTRVDGLHQTWRQFANTSEAERKKAAADYKKAVKGPGGKQGDPALNVLNKLRAREAEVNALPHVRWLPAIAAQAQALPLAAAITSVTAYKDATEAAWIAQQVLLGFSVLAEEVRDENVEGELATAARALAELRSEGLQDPPPAQVPVGVGAGGAVGGED